MSSTKTWYKSVSKFWQKLWRKLDSQTKKACANIERMFAAAPARTSRKAARARVLSKRVVARTSQRRKWATALWTAAATLLLATPVHAESLWLKAGSSVQTRYGDNRARRPGDILTILIDEAVKVTATQETKANKDVTLDNAVTSFLFPNSPLGTSNGDFPLTDITGSNQYNGKGNITYNQAVAAKASVMVVDILPNGNLVIEGLRSVLFANEKQYMILRGIVRADDVTAQNTVSSGQIANAYVEIKGEGDLSAAQRKGWLMKLNDFLNPF